MSNSTRAVPRARAAFSVSTDTVLDAALDAFAERGYEGTSVRELARDLGVSHNLIPQRIGSKEQLWYAAVDKACKAVADELTLVEEATHDDDLERLRALVVRFIEVNTARPQLLRIVRQEGHTPGPRLDHLFDNYLVVVQRYGERLLTRLREQGRVRTDSVSLVYFFMAHGAGGMVALPALASRFGDPVDRSDPQALREHALRATELLFDGLVVR